MLNKKKIFICFSFQAHNTTRPLWTPFTLEEEDEEERGRASERYEEAVEKANRYGASRGDPFVGAEFVGRSEENSELKGEYKIV